MLSGMFPVEAVVFLAAIWAYGVTMKTRNYLLADAQHAALVKGKARFLVGLGHVSALSMLVWAFLNFGWLAVVITFLVGQLAAALVTIGFVVPLREKENYPALFKVLLLAHGVVVLTAATGWAWYFFK